MLLIKGILMFIVGISGTAFTMILIIKVVIEYMDNSFVIPSYIEDNSSNRVYDSEISSDIDREDVVLDRKAEDPETIFQREQIESTVLLDDFDQNGKIK